MVTKVFRFFENHCNKENYCDVFITINISKNKKKYLISLNYKYGNKTISSTKSNPFFLKGLRRKEFECYGHKLKYNEFNHGYVDYLLMDFIKLTKHSGYFTGYDYKKELLRYLDIDMR